MYEISWTKQTHTDLFNYPNCRKECELHLQIKILDNNHVIFSLKQKREKWKFLWYVCVHTCIQKKFSRFHPRENYTIVALVVFNNKKTNKFNEKLLQFFRGIFSAKMSHTEFNGFEFNILWTLTYIYTLHILKYIHFLER